MDYSSEDEMPIDEITEVKRVLREAKARKKSIASKLSAQSERINSDREELQSVVKRQAKEIELLKESLSDNNLELRKARFELGQMVMKESKFSENQRILQMESRNSIIDYKAKVEQAQKITDDKNLYILKEITKVSKLVNGVHLSDSAVSSSGSKTTHLVMDAAVRDLNRLKNYLTSSVSSCNHSNDENNISGYGSLGGAGAFYNPSAVSCDQMEPTVDASLLDMCRSLEEENHTLLANMDAMKAQLSAAQSEADQNKLIPHYRLAILRSRGHAANLTEQLKREQFTTETLREQLEVTYQDLKKVVEEKKRLCKKLTKFGLQADERESYPEYSSQPQQGRHTNAVSSGQHQQHQQQHQHQLGAYHTLHSQSAPLSAPLLPLSHDPNYLHLLHQQAQLAQQVLLMQQQQQQQTQSSVAGGTAVQHTSNPVTQYTQSLSQQQQQQIQSQTSMLNQSHHISPYSSTEYLPSNTDHTSRIVSNNTINNNHTSSSASASRHSHERTEANVDSNRSSSAHHSSAVSSGAEILGLQESAIQSELSVLDSEIDELKLKLARAATRKSKSYRVSDSVLLGEKE